MGNLFGLSLIIVSTAIPFPWFLDILLGAPEPSAVLSQYIGSVAIILMGWSQFLATRAKGLETVFGAQDRNYVLHKWLGVSAMAAVLIHDTVDAELPDALETVFSEFGETLGEICLYGFLILVTITLIPFVPYRLWHWTHRFMGAFFALSALHYMLVPRAFELNETVGLYIIGFCVLGVLSYGYTLIPFAKKPGRCRYNVEDVRGTGNATAITLAPIGPGLIHRPGQFAFIRVETDTRRETHPFSISSAPQDNRALRFTIRPLGDFTARVTEWAQPGAQVTVEGPFGRFVRRDSHRNQVWIAAGVGITPFIAWAEALRPDAPPVDLFYCVRSPEEAPHLDDVQRLVEEKPNLTLHLIVTSREGRLTTARLQTILGDRLKTAEFAFCGPTSMRKTIHRDLTRMGVSKRRFQYELFEIRSGIDVLGWITHLIRFITAMRKKHLSP